MWGVAWFLKPPRSVAWCKEPGLYRVMCRRQREGTCYCIVAVLTVVGVVGG